MHDEKASISKQSLLSLGTILSTTTFMSMMSAEAGAGHSSNYCTNNHQNNMHLVYDQATSRVTATHKHYDIAHSNSHSSS